MNEQGPPTSPKRSRAFSYRSDKSGGSKKEDAIESPKDKAQRDQLYKGGSKVNPNVAIQEIQPGDRNMQEYTTIESLRSMQHTDSDGNVIADPDLSNPTRNRLERPLDTIRKFERQIDRDYKRRTSSRSVSYDQGAAQSRRNSNFGGYDGSPNHRGGYHPHGERPPSQYGPGPSAPPRMRYPPRQNSDPVLFGQRGYQQYNHERLQSPATVNTETGGSDSTGPWANSTNPSSENSSIERVQYASKQQADDGYAQPGYNVPAAQYPISENGAYSTRNGASQPPMPPAHHRQPIKLGNSNAIAAADDATVISTKLPTPVKPRPEAEKRKSWLKRTFSKGK